MALLLRKLPSTRPMSAQSSLPVAIIGGGEKASFCGVAPVVWIHFWEIPLRLVYILGIFPHYRIERSYVRCDICDLRVVENFYRVYTQVELGGEKMPNG